MDQWERVAGAAAARGGAIAASGATARTVGTDKAEAVAAAAAALTKTGVRANVPPGRGGEQEMESCISIKTAFLTAGSTQKGK